ncbi:Heparan-alpha-glucosaminide N-acetyltransferase [Carex littledalei]|uniref:Heparan-alpha-glucosaminide N-acetyltransferase n=1 Tax=Carex littledalei TaxID=544730 RepID=A0A833VJX7_9POAL|nr:Heparan-alpha-glucosaminide N-acetyltransferase [Carex littledalei]
MASQDLVRRSGADVEDQTNHDRLIAVTEVDEKHPKLTRSKRVASLDIFRGLTVALMVLVDGAGDEWPVIGHAPWNGCNLADFVMPFFLFIVGMAIPLSLKRIPDRGKAVKRVVVRTIKLLFWGILLQGGYSHAPDDLTYGVDMKHIRWCGILQRIAFAYLVVAILEIVTKEANLEDNSTSGFSIFRQYYRQWIVAACIFIIYMSLLYGTYVPDWEFRVQYDDSPDYGKVFKVICGTRGKLDQPCNAVGYIDRKILGINHMYKHPAWHRSKPCTEVSPYEGPFKANAPAWCLAPFEPEGILRHTRTDLNIGVPWALHFLFLGLFCILAMVDIVGMGNLFLPLEWIGMNAMLVYVMAAEGIFEGFLNGWYYKSTNNTLVYWVRKHVFVKVWHSKKVGILLYVLFAQILFWAIVAGILHRVGIYWKL